MTHISKDIMQLYILGRLDELESKKISFHLNECDQCFETYLELSGKAADSDNAYECGEVAARVSDRLNKKQQRVTFNLFRAYAAAASLTLVFLWSGVFDQITQKLPNVSLAIGSASADIFITADKLGEYLVAMFIR